MLRKKKRYIFDEDLLDLFEENNEELLLDKNEYKLYKKGNEFVIYKGDQEVKTFNDEETAKIFLIGLVNMNENEQKIDGVNSSKENKHLYEDSKEDDDKLMKKLLAKADKLLALVEEDDKEDEDKVETEVKDIKQKDFDNFYRKVRDLVYDIKKKLANADTNKIDSALSNFFSEFSRATKADLTDDEEEKEKNKDEEIKKNKEEVVKTNDSFGAFNNLFTNNKQYKEIDTQSTIAKAWEKRGK